MIRLTFDPKYGVAYLRLREGKTTRESHEIAPDVVVDLADDGLPVGIEFLNPSEILGDGPYGVEIEVQGAVPAPAG